MNLPIWSNIISELLHYIRYYTIPCIHTITSSFLHSPGKMCILQDHQSLLSWHVTHYLELGYSDPTSNEPLHLMIRGIQRLQEESPRLQLPFTINILYALQQHLRRTVPASLCVNNAFFGQLSLLPFYGLVNLQAHPCYGQTLH